MGPVSAVGVTLMVVLLFPFLILFEIIQAIVGALHAPRD